MDNIQQWEYVFKEPEVKDNSAGSLMNLLRIMGDDGWECVCVAWHLNPVAAIFKRPKLNTNG